MLSHANNRELAVALRKKGHTYKEILESVPVAKSTLSEWLKDVGLSVTQKQRITEKKILSRQKGAARRRELRVLRTKEIHTVAKQEILPISKRDLWILGTALYWAEGAKQRDNSVSQRVTFSNSDPEMIRLFLHWLQVILLVQKENISISIYIHENNKHRLLEVQRYWSAKTRWPIESFAKFYFKRHNPRTVRKKIGDDYYGLVRIDVKSSTDLNRKIAGWVKAISDWGIV